MSAVSDTAVSDEPHEPHAHPRVDHPDPATRASGGRAARKRLPRAQLGAWEAPPGRAHPADLLRGQEATRVPELLAIRHERMMASPFAFYRGAAVVMAADLGAGPDSGLTVQCCGDAHLANFGAFASPERALLFDINDFDETSPGPFEWDVLRLAASFDIAGRALELDDAARRACVAEVARAYRESMATFSTMRNLEVWYARLDITARLEQLAAATGQRTRTVRRNAAKVTKRDNLRALRKLTERVDGTVRFRSDPPLLVPITELRADVDFEAGIEYLRERLLIYRRSLPHDRRHLLERYRLVDLARKVVGVGSVGTRCWVALLLGRDDDDPLFLQIKEAGPSVLEPYSGRSPFANHGRRVVEGQRLLQAASDILLGWSSAEGVDGVASDYYVRQLWDGKASADIDTMGHDALLLYARMCGWTLARAHAVSGDPIAIAAYLGTSDRFDRSVADFAAAYADQNQRDFEAAAAADLV